MAEHAAARRSSSRTRTVGLVASHRPWRSELARYVQDHVTGLQVRVLRDPRAVDGSIDVVVIDDSSTFLNRAAVRRLADAGVHVIGIYDPSEQHGHGQRHLNDLGIDDVAVATIPTAELVELIARVTEIERPLPDDAELARLVSGDTVVADRSLENRQPAPEGRGTLISGRRASRYCCSRDRGRSRGRAGQHRPIHPAGGHRRGHSLCRGQVGLSARADGARCRRRGAPR